jgi:hypothetical protein
MMTTDEIVDDKRPGRRSGIRRLVYRSPNEKEGKGPGRWHDTRDWSAIKEQLRLTVRRAPEVVINVKGSRLGKDDDHSAIKGVLRYMMYISRKGQLPLEDQHCERIEGVESIKEVHASWDLDMQRMRSGKSEPLHPSFNIIFSMPAKTDPEKMAGAVRDFAIERFQAHQYVMVLHTNDTDPADNPPEHPHVHLILRAEDETGQRIYIRKTDLRVWREEFAAKLRAHGVDANATSRAERGKTAKSIQGAEWHVINRYEKQLREGKNPKPPTAKTARFWRAAEELQNGLLDQKPWEIAIEARRRDVVRELKKSVERLHMDGENEFAAEVERFIHEMPPVESETQKIQRSLVKQIRERLNRIQKQKNEGFARWRDRASQY